MPTIKAMKKKVVRKLRSAKNSVRKLTVRLNKMMKKTSGKKKRHRSKRRTKKRRRKRR
jgi:hypothetical protein